jgi:hypothetical protein
MINGAHLGGLEVREEGRGVRLAGRFPYGVEATMGRGRAEVIAARAFGADVGGGGVGGC